MAATKAFLTDAATPADALEPAPDMAAHLYSCDAADSAVRIRGHLGSMPAVGITLRYLREERGWTQSDLAREAGVKRSVISAAENRYHPMNMSTLWKIAAAFGLDVVLWEPPDDDPYMLARQVVADW